MINSIETITSTFSLQMKQSFARPMYKFCLIIQPIIYTILTYMMFKNSGHENFISYVVLGTGILSLWSCICFSSAGDIERERFMGTLQVIYCTPTSFKLIMFGKILGNTLLGLVPFTISFGIVKVFFGGQVYISDPLKFVIGMLATILSFIGISLAFSAIFTLSRNSRMLMNCIEYPIYILCGVLFPIEILPRWILPLSYILSPTWAVRVLRAGVNGISDSKVFYNDMGILLILTAVYFIFSYILFDVIDKRARIKATLEVS